LRPEQVDEELRALYGLPLEEFTAGRNELARRLKQDHDARAGEVAQLRKPTVPVWAVNQLARHDQLGMRRLLAAGAALRKAQERALEGAGTAGLAKAQAEEREALRKLTARARSLLNDAGRPATDATLARISTTLAAAAVDESVRDALKAGRLDRELEPLGFDALAGMEANPRPSPAKDTSVADRRTQEAEERRRRERRARVRDLEREAREAERVADRAEADARKKRETADAARSAADRAAAELDD
jgi:hypothetical protein